MFFLYTNDKSFPRMLGWLMSKLLTATSLLSYLKYRDLHQLCCLACLLFLVKFETVPTAICYGALLSCIIILGQRRQLCADWSKKTETNAVSAQSKT